MLVEAGGCGGPPLFSECIQSIDSITMSKMKFKTLFFLIISTLVLESCTSDYDELEGEQGVDGPANDGAVNVSAIEAMFAGTIDINNLFNYEDQEVPDYIRDDNTNGNHIENETATLGRVLFYDKNLSFDNTISCASCHQQAFAFSDPNTLSEGVNGVTGRHSMRLVNARFADEDRFFWDERAETLEDQTTMPIQDHVEMGFSGTEGDPDFDDLIEKLEGLDYMTALFELAYGDPEITEARVQTALAQFIRSIQSFDSKYDEGRAMVRDDRNDFPNFTAEENLGKTLFMSDTDAGGANCASCHRPPEFDIDPNSDNNGVVGVAGDPNDIDVTVTRSPSLRDLLNPEGMNNGPFMHDGSLTSLDAVMAHYNNVPDVNGNDNLDRRLRGGRGGGDLRLSADERDAIVAFLRTLTGEDMYTNDMWSDPFVE